MAVRRSHVTRQRMQHRQIIFNESPKLVVDRRVNKMFIDGECCGDLTIFREMARLLVRLCKCPTIRRSRLRQLLLNRNHEWLRTRRDDLVAGASSLQRLAAEIDDAVGERLC